jgi:hypothetical protein
MFFDRGRSPGALLFSPEQGEHHPRHGPDPDTGILWTPQLAAMRADPRMAPIVRSIGLADYWRAAGVKPTTPVAGL